MEIMNQDELSRLGRREATDDRHLRRFSMVAEAMPTEPTSVVLGIPWYGGWGRSGLIEKDNAVWLPPEDKWGSIVGGHAIATRPIGVRDNWEWWVYHDQIGGSCTGWSAGRALTIKTRKRYGCQHIYNDAQARDEWADTPPEEGSSVRAAHESLRVVGPYDKTGKPIPEDRIEVYRWNRSIEEIAACLSPADGGISVLNAGYLTLLQSWGMYWPHFVRMELEAANRVIFREDGEAAVITAH